MVFSDPFFLFAFLPIALLAITAAQGRGRNLVILSLSLLFYYWNSGTLTLLIVFSLALNFLVARRLGPKAPIWLLPTGIAINIGLLVYFKYAYFLADSVDAIVGTQFSTTFSGIILPVGISFFTFQGISYLIDVNRGDIKADDDIIRFGAYLSFFPQLIAGPIVRYADVIEDYISPRQTLAGFGDGAVRFTHGLAKKVIIADSAGAIADACFAHSGGDVTSAVAWLGGLAYTIQIYFDFSGYSDMAIGIAQMCGIRLLENFKHPYSSSTITEFWRRWHISLSSWFRDYLYIPLGGNRVSSIKIYRNLILVFITTGIWHGAAWTFLLWGLYHGFFLVMERFFLGSAAAKFQSLELRFFYVLPVALIGWVLFRADSLDQAMAFYSAMFSWSDANAWTLPLNVVEAATPLTVFAMLLGCGSFLLRPDPSIGEWLVQRKGLPLEVAKLALLIPVLACALMFALAQDFSPFLYFRF